MTFNHNGQTITLTEEAHVCGTYEQPYYIALAEDEEGNRYEVNWMVTHPDFENLEDESEACDWDIPTSIDRI